MRDSTQIRRNILAIDKYMFIINEMEDRGYKVTGYDPGITYYDKSQVQNGIYSHGFHLDLAGVNLVESLMKEVELQQKVIEELDARIEDFKTEEAERDRKARLRSEKRKKT